MVSVKKAFFIMFSITIVISLSVFSFISYRYMQDYFTRYVDATYQSSVENITNFANSVINGDNYSKKTLNSYIKDPIYYVEIYDDDNNLLINSGMSFVRGNLDSLSKVTDEIDIMTENNKVGRVVIIKEKKTLDTVTSKLFSKALIKSVIVSFLVTILSIFFVIQFGIKAVLRNFKAVENYVDNDIEKPENVKVKELAYLLDIIEKYKHSLKLKDKVKKEKFDKLLHETKTPLTIIKTQVEGAIDGVIEVDDEVLKSVVDELDSLNIILNDVTNIIDGTNVEEEIVRSDIDYADEIEKIIKSIKPGFDEKGIEIIFNKEPFMLNTNKNILNHAIYNVLLNAFKYTQEGSIEIELDNALKSITIRDSGIGIEEADLKKIFSPYYRGENAKTYEGQGLGLSNVREDLTKLDFTIEVRSVINKFTEFEITQKIKI